MRVKLNIIQCYPDELYGTYLIPWCESFLTNGLSIRESDLREYNIRSVPGLPDNSGPASRAVELFRTGTFTHPISVSGNKSRAWERLAKKEPIITDFGFVAYLISKNMQLMGNNPAVSQSKAFSAICAISTVVQYLSYPIAGSTRKLSLNSIFQAILESFPGYERDYTALQYLASGMICTLKSTAKNESLINQVLIQEPITELIITNNVDNSIRDRIDISTFDDQIGRLHTDGLHLDNTTNQRFPNFFIGNYNQNPERGFVNMASLYFSSFLRECAKIEIENSEDEPFGNIYSNENYVLDNSWYNILTELEIVFEKYLPGNNSLEELMDALKNGTLEAIKNLNWNDSGNIQSDGSGDNWIYYGAPGTGKSFTVDERLRSLSKKYVSRVTFHPDYDYASFVGGYKPTMEENNEGGKSIVFNFVPQIFVNIYVDAWNDVENNYYLVIEEINRGNCAEIFGDIFQLLDRKSDYEITPSKELKDYLGRSLNEPDQRGLVEGKLILPRNLFIYATMNTSDQSLYPMDSAFKRRWNWEYIPICYDEKYENGRENESFNYVIKLDESNHFRWIEFIEVTNRIIKNNPNLGMDKCIGNYFIKGADKAIELEEFINKVIFYLWNDVFKDEDESIFPEDMSYEDFFPILTEGKRCVLNIIESDLYESVSVQNNEYSTEK